ncbi:MAG: sugar kinase, partial [Alphaproteobacteria bacterium]|nr:sugar kinase [Alphaproteobacteria bacterium]
PRLWSSPSDAQAARDAAREVATIGLPTLEDEALLAGFSRAEDVAAHWRSARCGEVVVKQGATGCLIPDGRIIPPPAIIQPVDTSGAGDAFNAGYLNARLHGADPAAAALAGHRLGGWVITQRGAIPPRSPDAPYA